MYDVAAALLLVVAAGCADVELKGRVTYRVTLTVGPEWRQFSRICMHAFLYEQVICNMFDVTMALCMLRIPLHFHINFT